MLISGVVHPISPFRSFRLQFLCQTEVTLKASPTEPVKPEEFDISGHYKPEEVGSTDQEAYRADRIADVWERPTWFHFSWVLHEVFTPCDLRRTQF